MGNPKVEVYDQHKIDGETLDEKSSGMDRAASLCIFLGIVGLVIAATYVSAWLGLAVGAFIVLLAGLAMAKAS